MFGTALIGTLYDISNCYMCVFVSRSTTDSNNDLIAVAVHKFADG